MTQPWRFRAKVVGWIDMIFTILQMAVILILAVITQVATDATINHPEMFDQLPKSTTQGLDQEDAKAAVTMLLVFAWTVVVVGFILSVIQIWAIVKLMSATEPGRDPNESYKMARTYITVLTVFLIFAVIGHIKTQSYIALAVELIIRGVFFFVVYQFLDELKMEAGNTLPTSVMASAPKPR